MKYRRLGRSALQVSELCLGTMNFGPRTSAHGSHAILDAAVDLGINFIDTANQYGGALGVGTTETIIGEWLAQHPNKRERIVLATKVHEPMSGDINDRGLSARHIQMACEASLRRLQVDHIELYQFHHIDRAAPAEELMQAADRLIAQGKITYLGSSNFPGWKIAQLGERARASGKLGLVAEQHLYNLIERRAELEVIPAAIDYGLGVIAWSPLAGGLLAGPSTDPGRRQDQALPSERQAQIARFTALSADLGASPSSVALAWLLHRPGLSAVIAGPASVEQLAGIAGVPELALSAEVLAALDKIFPPCGAAPEAYAW
jgi:NDP-hexose C3-ketoreductase / dTDP-4-oxo-2-deoxy-alpha-D-pentos-2-ene 2,3-reductase